MFQDHLRAAIGSASGLAPLQQLSSLLWKGYSAGSLSEIEAQTLSEQIEAKKALARGPTGVAGSCRPVGWAFKPRKSQHVPRRPEILARRRRLAAAGGLPPALAASFTLAEQAVMRIIGNQIRQSGTCDLYLGKIAALAGCSRRTVQRTLKVAVALGVITVQERRRRGHKSLTNLIRCVSPAWKVWLSHGREDRVTISAPHGYKDSFLVRNRPTTAASRGNERHPKGFPRKKKRPSPS